MPDEFAVAGVAQHERGARFEEHVAVMPACWAADPVIYDGEHYRVPAARIGPKPRAGAVPLLIGGVARPAVQRAARLGDGFTAAFRDWDSLEQQLGWYRETQGAGPVVLRVNGDEPDIARADSLGVDEVIWDSTFAGLDPDAQVAALEAMASK